MKHKHAEMIKAKADNMELVIFTENSQNNGDWWAFKSDMSILPCFSSDKYFACLPQHQEACLHWLNGGEVEFKGAFEWLDMHMEDFEWSPCCIWMIEQEIRIKPKKVKRWVGVHRSGSTTMARESEDAVNAELLGDTGWSIHEIEIEK